jgi:hypothetical protein
MGRTNAKYAVYAAVSLASFAVGSAVMTKAAPPTPTPVPSATASASATPSASPKPSTPPSMAPGLYVQVTNGAINVQNGTSGQTSPGQFGFTPAVQPPPVILPNNPGLQFTPPPAFSSTTGAQGTTPAKPGAVDCIVR